MNKDKNIYSALKQTDKDIYNLSEYVYTYSGTITDSNTTVKYFSDMVENFEEIKKEIKTAKDFIFLEYFIIGKGVMWGEILEILKEKVEQGVEVRLLYDGTCSFNRLPIKYPKEMEAIGIKCKVFQPLLPLFTTYQNHRDHRKILVIDGKTAFTGGLNLADEYIGVEKPFGEWKDSGIMLKGNAVKDFTLMFLQMWNMKQTEKDDYFKYLSIDNPQKSDGYIMGYGDSPVNDEEIAQDLYIDMINNAKNYVYITTPYLVPSYELMHAICFAAKRGVDVRIILPNIPDKKYAFFLGRTYYGKLLDSGVKLYQWEKGFVHSKLFVVDDISAVVGTVNLDFRSLFLHFECGVHLYKSSEIEFIKDDIEKLISESIQIDKKYVENLPKIQKILGSLLRLFAPLM